MDLCETVNASAKKDVSIYYFGSLSLGLLLQLYGYHDDGEKDDPVALNLEGGRVFAVAHRRRIGDAAGHCILWSLLK